MVSSLTNNINQRMNAPGLNPFDQGLNSWLDRSMPFDHSLDQKHWEAFTPIKSQANYQAPTNIIREGSTKAIVQQQVQLQQDIFQRQTAEIVNNKKTELELPQRDASLQSQIQQVSTGIRGIMRNLDRVNLLDTTVREAAASQVAALMEGRKQAQREGSRSLLDRLREIATVTKANNGVDVVKKPKKQNEKRVEPIGSETEKRDNLAAGIRPNANEL